MGGKTDIVKGRVEEAAGALANNEHLRNKGVADQEVGKVKEVIQKVANSAKAAATNAGK